MRASALAPIELPPRILLDASSGYGYIWRFRGAAGGIDMSKTSEKPTLRASGPMTAMGIGFLAVGVSGQPAFVYVGMGLLIPGVVLLAGQYWSKRRQA